MKKIVFLCMLMTILITISFSSYSQRTESPYKNKVWQPLNSKDGVEIYYKYEDCIDSKNGINQEQVILKVVNTTNNNIMLSWDLEKWHEEICDGCDPNGKDNHFTIKLKAGETIIGGCETRLLHKELIIFSMFLDKENSHLLSQFHIKNMVINIVN